MKKEIVMPFVHPNGTSKQELLDLREQTYEAILATLEVLKQMAPNGRDYYPDPGRMERAVAQHTARMKVLTDMMGELEVECRHIQQSAGGR